MLGIHLGFLILIQYPSDPRSNRVEGVEEGKEGGYQKPWLTEEGHMGAGSGEKGD